MDTPGNGADRVPKRKRRKRRSASLLSPTGRPPSRAGRPPRSPEPPNPQIAERQERHFDLYVQGASVPAIAKRTGFSRETVSLDIRMECERRAVEMVQDRQLRIAASVARCEAVITRAIIRGEAARLSGTEEIDLGDGRKEHRVKSPKIVAVANVADKLVLQAQRQIDAICGLTAPLPAGGAPAPGVTQQNLVVVMLENMPEEARRQTLERIRDEAAALGALPVNR